MGRAPFQMQEDKLFGVYLQALPHILNIDSRVYRLNNIASAANYKIVFPFVNINNFDHVLNSL